MSIELNKYILYWYFQQNQYLNINTHAVHSMGLYSLDPHPRVTDQRGHALRRHWLQIRLQVLPLQTTM